MHDHKLLLEEIEEGKKRSSCEQAISFIFFLVFALLLSSPCMYVHLAACYQAGSNLFTADDLSEHNLGLC